MAEDFDEVTGEVLERVDDALADPAWRIDGLGTLDWALAKLAGIEREMEQNNQLALAAHRRVDAWLKQANEKLGGSAAFFRGHITAYANEHKAELLTGKKKSRDLPNGKVSWRKVGGGLKVVQEEALRAWVVEQANPGWFDTKIEPRLFAIRSDFANREDTPPGMERVPEEDRLTITATGTELTKRSNDHE